MLTLRKITYFLLGLMLFIPALAFLPEFLNLSKDIMFYFRLAFWACGFFFLIHSSKSNQKIGFPKMLYFLLFYIIYLFIWSFFNGDMARRGLLKIIINNVQLSTLFVVLIIYNTKFSEKFISAAITIIKYTIIIAAAVSVIQVIKPNFMMSVYYKDMNFMGRSLYSIRRVSIFGYIPLEYGLSFIPLLSSIIGVIYMHKKKIPFTYLVLGGISALLTNTRFIMVGFLLLASQFFIIYKKILSKILKYLIITILLFIVLTLVLSNLGYDFGDWYQERLFKEGSIEEITRYKAIENFMIFFPRYYLLGNGEGLSDEIEAASNAVGSSQIHVGYLSTLVYYGIVGSFFLFGFWFLIAKKFYQTAKKTGYWGSFFAMLTYLWAQATLVHFTIFFYGLIFAFVFDKYYQDKYLTEENKAIHTGV